MQLIDYLGEVNRVLREQLGQSRFRFNHDQSGRLAVTAKGLGSKLLREVASLVLWFGITVTYFAGVQAAAAKAFVWRRVISLAKSSRVKVQRKGEADFS